MQADAVLADKGYDANHLVDRIQADGAMAVIPPERNRKQQRTYDRHLYKDRNLIERTQSSNSDASQLVMKSWLAITCHFLTSSALTSGLLNY